jgi:hypothetical protein
MAQKVIANILDTWAERSQVTDALEAAGFELLENISGEVKYYKNILHMSEGTFYGIAEFYTRTDGKTIFSVDDLAGHRLTAPDLSQRSIVRTVQAWKKGSSAA